MINIKCCEGSCQSSPCWQLFPTGWASLSPRSHTQHRHTPPHSQGTPLLTSPQSPEVWPLQSPLRPIPSLPFLQQPHLPDSLLGFLPSGFRSLPSDPLGSTPLFLVYFIFVTFSCGEINTCFPSLPSLSVQFSVKDIQAVYGVTATTHLQNLYLLLAKLELSTDTGAPHSPSPPPLATIIFILSLWLWLP